MDNESGKIQAQCHCGNIQISVEKLTETITSCNCSICGKYAAVWAYYKPELVVITYREQNSEFYIWGDRELEFHHCTKCGCVTHYVTVEVGDGAIFALNTRMLDSELLKDIPVRYVDGASAPLRN